MRDEGVIDVPLFVFALTVLSVGVCLAIARPMRQDAVEPRPTGMKIDLNTADAPTLQLLPGLGRKIAASVVEYREEHGRFDSVEQLDDVHRVGPKTVAKLTPYATAGSSTVDKAHEARDEMD